MSRKNILIALAIVLVAGAVVGANFYFKKDKGLPVTTEKNRSRHCHGYFLALSFTVVSLLPWGWSDTNE